MGTKFSSVLVYFLILVGVWGAVCVDSRADEMLVLEVTGVDGARFDGDCRLLSRFGSEKRHRLKGQVPSKFWLPAEAARCSFDLKNVRGKVFATLSRNGTVQIRQASQYPLPWISLTSSGPWGEARGVASASRPLWQ